MSRTELKAQNLRCRKTIQTLGKLINTADLIEDRDAKALCTRYRIQNFSGTEEEADYVLKRTEDKIHLGFRTVFLSKGQLFIHPALEVTKKETVSS